MAAMPAATMTIPGVELVKAGTWTPGTHPQGLTITAAQLADIVAAGTDALTDTAPIKLGHRGKFAELGDGAPAFGWVTNLRLNAAGDTVLGDLTNVPAKLAAIIPAAYAKRSAELKFGVKTAAGRTYAAVLSGLALLGASAPAVKGLADITDLYNLADAAGDTPDAELELASTDVELAELADTLGITIPAGGIPSRQTFEIPPPHPLRETETMDDAKLRSILKLADDADLEAELAKLLAAGATPPVEDPPAPAAETPPATPPAPAATPELVGAGAALSAEVLAGLKAAGLTVVDSASLSELTGAAEDLKTARLERIVDEAVAAGKLAPAETAAYFTAATADKPATGLLVTDEAGATALLASMVQRFAVAELGDASNVELAAADVDTLVDGFIATLPGVRA